MKLVIRAAAKCAGEVNVTTLVSITLGNLYQSQRHKEYTSSIRLQYWYTLVFTATQTYFGLGKAAPTTQTRRSEAFTRASEQASKLQGRILRAGGFDVTMHL